MLPEFDIITFDCYGTLIDWEEGITSAFQAEAARDGVLLERDAIVAAYMEEEPKVEAGPFRSYREILRETAVRVAERLSWKIDSSRGNFLPASLPNWKPFSDTNPALERLVRRFQLGILSNIDDDLIAETRKHFTADFDLIVTAAQVRSYKPGRAHFTEALARTAGNRLLHAARSYFHDVVPCSQLGIPVVWVNRNHASIPAGGAEPTHEVPDLAGLADLLFGKSLATDEH